MRRPLIPLAVAVVGVMVGAAVSGLPTAVANDVTADQISTSAPTTTTTPPVAMATTTPPTVASTTTVVSAAPVTSAVGEPTDVRVVVSNAGAAPGTATRVAGDLRTLGFPDVLAADALEPRRDSVVLYEPSFEDAALLLATARGIDIIEPRGSEPVTAGDVRADLWLLLGSGAS